MRMVDNVTLLHGVGVCPENRLEWLKTSTRGLQTPGLEDNGHVQQHQVSHFILSITLRI